MHDDKARTQSTAKMAPVSRMQARMMCGIAAFLIIHEVEKRRKHKRSQMVCSCVGTIFFQYYYYFVIMLLLSIFIFITIARAFQRLSRVFNASNKAEVVRYPSNHDLSPSSTHLRSHAHDQTITCNNFYLSHKNWRASFSAN